MSKDSESICLDCDTARQLLCDVMQRLNVPAGEIEIIADTLMEASLSGHDTHGIGRIVMYVKGIRRGTMVPGANVEIVRETESTLLLDGGGGMGPVTATHAFNLASHKARKTGVGCVSTINSNDIARLGTHVMKPAERGLIAILMANDAGLGPYVAPWGGTQPFLSTNPIAAGIPRAAEDPIVIDISTSVAAAAKVYAAADRGKPVPEGWLISEDGSATTDAASWVKKQSALLPLGGTVAGHKGFALALLVDVLAGALGGAGCAGRDPGVENYDPNAIFALVIDPEKFGSRSDFTASVEGLVQKLKAVKKAPGVEEILVPGERAARERRRRQKEGIPVDAITWSKISKVLKSLGIEKQYAPARAATRE